MLCVWYICWFSIFTLVNVKRSRDITTVGHLRLVFILFNFLVTVSPNLCLNFTIFFSKQTTYFFLSSNKKFPQSRITIFFCSFCNILAAVSLIKLSIFYLQESLLLSYQFLKISPLGALEHFLTISFLSCFNIIHRKY